MYNVAYMHNKSMVKSVVVYRTNRIMLLCYQPVVLNILFTHSHCVCVDQSKYMYMYIIYSSSMMFISMYSWSHVQINSIILCRQVTGGKAKHGAIVKHQRKLVV